MKSFDDQWSGEEIYSHVAKCSILVLFAESQVSNKEAIITIYSKIDVKRKEALLDKILEYFGGRPLTSQICVAINEFAMRWHRKNILKKKSRVINVRRGKQWK